MDLGWDTLPSGARYHSEILRLDAGGQPLFLVNVRGPAVRAAGERAVSLLVTSEAGILSLGGCCAAAAMVRGGAALHSQTAITGTDTDPPDWSANVCAPYAPNNKPGLINDPVGVATIEISRAAELSSGDSTTNDAAYLIYQDQPNGAWEKWYMQGVVILDTLSNGMGSEFELESPGTFAGIIIGRAASISRTAAKRTVPCSLTGISSTATRANLHPSPCRTGRTPRTSTRTSTTATVSYRKCYGKPGWARQSPALVPGCGALAPGRSRTSYASFQELIR